MTSSSGRQVKSILWKELQRVHREAPHALGGIVQKVPDAGYHFPDGREVIGFSTSEPEKMAGFSGPNILFILDEASGIDEPIFEAIEGNRAGGARIVLFSNPTRTSGTFYDAFNSKRELWHTLHVSSEETPNVCGDGPAIPGLATKGWVDEKRIEWGPHYAESPLYQVRVGGNFPTQGENAVIPLAFVELAASRWAETVADGRLEIGVDVARFGDDETVIVLRRGLRVLGIEVRNGLDGPGVAAEVMALVRTHRRPGEVKPRVKVDVIGVGASAYDALAVSKEIETLAVNVSESADRNPSEGPGYHRLRDQLWFALRDWLRDGGTFPPDGRLEAELVAPLYGFDSQGHVQVEPKSQIKKRLGRSPDRADGLALSVYEPPGQAASQGAAQLYTHDYDAAPIGLGAPTGGPSTDDLMRQWAGG